MAEAYAVPSRTGRLIALRAALMGLAGRRRYVLAACLGGLATLALPPVFAAPLLWIAFPGLIWLLDGAATRRSAFFIGWWFGFLHFLLGLYWVSFSMLVDVARFWWLMPFASAGLPAVLAIFVGLATLAVHESRLTGIARPLALALAWTVAEWLRGHLFTGFPWNLVGYAWVAWTPVVQVTAIVGIYGLSLLTVVSASLAACLGDRALAPAARLGAAAAGVLLMVAVGVGGAIRLAGATDAMVPGVTLRLVQPDIAEKLKRDVQALRTNIQRHFALTMRPGHDRLTAVVWPESAMPFFLNADAAARTAIGGVAPPGGLILTGGLRVSPPGAAGQRQYWNTLYAIDGSGAIRGTYDKAHLVPFGEYVPFRRWLPIPALATLGDFTPGPGPRTLHLPGLPPVGPLICYEGIFPEEVVDPADRPQWLLTITNDGWFGRTAGPHQHFAMEAVRAVEQGLPMVRDANTGVSGVVDPYGRVLSTLGLGAEGIIDTPLPVALAPTPYARFGDRLFFALFGVVALIMLATRRAGRWRL